MKKCLVVLLCFCFIVKVNAMTYFTYEDAASNAQTYNNLDKYLITPSQYKSDFPIADGIPYNYLNEKNKYNQLFKYSGFLSRNEFDITKNKYANGKSYLSEGNYWLVDFNNKHYSVEGISNKYIEKSSEKISGIKITKFVKNNTKVSGLGTYSDPWVFNSTYSIKISVNDFGKIKSDTSALSNEVNEYVSEGKGIRIKLVPNSGYEYKGNSCNAVVEGEYLIINNINYDISCMIEFGAK